VEGGVAIDDDPVMADYHHTITHRIEQRLMQFLRRAEVKSRGGFVHAITIND
jgi:hypothetical protein